MSPTHSLRAECLPSCCDSAEMTGMCYSAQLCVGPWDLNSGPSACRSSGMYSWQHCATVSKVWIDGWEVEELWKVGVLRGSRLLGQACGESVLALAPLVRWAACLHHDMLPEFQSNESSQTCIENLRQNQILSPLKWFLSGICYSYVT